MNNIRDIAHFLFEVSSKYGTKTGFTFLKNRNLYNVTYSAFFQHVQLAADYLADRTRAEKRIAIIAENSYEWMVYYWGVMLLGKSAVLVDPEMQQEEVSKRMALLSVHTVLAGEEPLAFHGAEVIRMEVPEKYDAEHMDLGKRLTESCESLEATVLFSTGTTGDYKTIRLSQKNVVSAFMPDTAEHADSVFLTLPFYHSLTINGLITAMICGCRIYIGSGIKYVLKDMQAFEPEMIYVTPVYMNMFYQKIARHSEDETIVRRTFGRNLRYIVTGGASPQKKVLSELRARGIRILTSYGSSETFCIASGEIGEIENCVGHVAPHMRVDLVDGEIVVAGPTVFMGYSENENLSDAWYHTGDLGYIDENGYLFLTGRKKNLIILSNGKNVSPEHLEAELCAIAEVTEAVVYAEKDKICAEIYLGNGADEEMRQRVKDKIKEQNITRPTYYQVQKVLFREEPFVHSGVGKIRRITGNC